MRQLLGLVLVVECLLLQGCQQQQAVESSVKPAARRAVPVVSKVPAPAMADIIESPLDQHVDAYAKTPEQAEAIRQAAKALSRVPGLRLSDTDAVDDVMTSVQYSLSCLRTVFPEGDYRTKVMTTIPYLVLDTPAKRAYADKVYRRWRENLQAQSLTEDQVLPSGSGCAKPLDYERLTAAQEEARLARLQRKADELSAEID